jgi:hypothetical protein
MKNTQHIRSQGGCIILGVAFCLMLLLCAFSQNAPAQTQTPEEKIRSAILSSSDFVSDLDYNEDGKLDVADLIYVLKFIPTMASFDSSTSEIEEGGNGTVRINFTAAFTGTLTYTVSGTAEVGTDYPALAGSLDVDNATSVEIPISINDDVEVEEVETITLTLEEAPDNLPGYYPFAPTEHTVYVQENDALWRGSLFRPLADTAVTVDFRMKITRQGDTTTGKLLTDGIGIIPASDVPVTDEALGTGWTEWPMDITTFSDTAFDATVQGLPIHAIQSAGGTIIPAMTRGLTFTVTVPDPKDPNAEDNGHKIESDLMTGDFTEQVVYDTLPQLGYDASGTFFLQKRIAIADTSQI